MRTKVDGILTVNRKTFETLKSQLPDDMDYDEWKEIVTEGNLQIRNQIINDPRGYVFPLSYLGILQVAKNKPKYKVVDIMRSKQEKRTCYYSNYHSFKYVYKIRWYSAKFSMFPIYKFIPCRQFKRDLAKAIKSEKINYFTFTYSEVFKSK